MLDDKRQEYLLVPLEKCIRLGPEKQFVPPTREPEIRSLSAHPVLSNAELLSRRHTEQKDALLDEGLHVLLAVI